MSGGLIRLLLTVNPNLLLLLLLLLLLSSIIGSLVVQLSGHVVFPVLLAHVLGRVLETRVMRPAQGVTAIEATIFGERVVAASELAGDLFVGGPSSGHQHDVKSGQAEDGNEKQADDDHQDNGHEDVRLVQLVLVVQHVHQTHDEDGSHVNGQRHEEHEEVSVVSSADAVIDPRAVMIEDFDAVVAH